MKAIFNNFISGMISLVFLLCTILILPQPKVLYASESNNSIFIKKVSKAYTKKFCNAIGFGLSKDSAMNFSLEENNQVFKKRSEFKNIDKESLAEEIAIKVIENCGYPLDLSGEEGIEDFKSYYLVKDIESSKKGNNKN